MELALGAVLNGVPGDFVETGVRAGGTAILLCKVLERCDPDGQRVLWAADSFQVREMCPGVAATVWLQRGVLASCCGRQLKEKRAGQAQRLPTPVQALVCP
jgi:hypothetical protein